MSVSFVRGKDLSKSECPNCKRTVVWENLDDGTKVATDTELISVVYKRAGAGARPTSRTKVHVRRVHSELCEKYKRDAEKLAFRKEQERLAKKNGARSQVAPELGTAAIVAPAPAPPKYASYAAAKRSVTAAYAAVAKMRAKL